MISRPLLAAISLLLTIAPMPADAPPLVPFRPVPSGPEATAARVCREFYQAQITHARQDRDGDGIREYAQFFASTREGHDGLYHRGAGDPLWAHVSKARDLGSFANRSRGHRPFEGYHYAILTRQGPDAPGGERDYLVGRHLTGGFALVAWPAQYGATGVHTFLVNQNGIVLRKNLGPQTARLARQMTSYNPDASWKPVQP